MSDYSPWAHLATHHPDLTVRTGKLLGGAGGEWTDSTLCLDEGLTSAEATCTLAREIVHIEQPGVSDRRAEEIAAAQLISDEELARMISTAMLGAMEQMAERAQVDTVTIAARLRTLNQEVVGDMVRTQVVEALTDDVEFVDGDEIVA
ncbi:metalloprotease [Gordonia phage VanLee]|uniref:Metalloprotease n=1 Tax=Gordonia phage VanLee TaxID=2845816 RepID=A0A8F2DA91_9CAUD|nr:metalloprotease [Gordonia phage VanLee]QWS68151.1 metalloprotease [Gordonia phage VanLee]